jgi:hypothetical protein
LTDEQAAQLQRAERRVVEAKQQYETALARWAAAVRATRSVEDLQPVAVGETQKTFLQTKERYESLQVERDRLRQRLYAERDRELRRQSLASVVTNQELGHHDARRLADEHAGNGRQGLLSRLFGRKR